MTQGTDRYWGKWAGMNYIGKERTHWMLFTGRLRCVVFVGCMAYCCLVWGQDRESNAPLDIAYWREYDRLAAFRQSEDLAGLFEEAEVIELTWSGRSIRYYAQLMRELCAKLNTLNQADAAGQARIKVIAQRALEKRTISSDTDFPIQAHFDLLEFTQPLREVRLKRMREAEQYDVRQREFEAWLEVLQRIEDARDPLWDPNLRPFRNLSPPPETGLPSGIAPEAIEDPYLRAQYETELHANRELGRRNEEQREIEKLRKAVLYRIAQFVEFAYCPTEEDRAELNALLDECLTDESSKFALRSALSERLCSGEKDLEKGLNEQRDEKGVP